jgi:hypothetical protein
MAFGFRECCNEFSYFTVTGIPGSVSEFETYYVRTVEGLNFCATYVQIPTLNYQAPNYILLELTQQTSCESCLALFPCPEEDIILVNQFTAGSVQIDTDCQVNTLQPMIVQCQTINPTFSNTLDGTVALLVVGGTPPYTFLGESPSEVLGVFQDGDVYTVYQNVSAGTYTTTTVDSTGDFSITRNCVLSGPPPIPVVTPIVQPATFFGVPDGSISLTIVGGIPPYTIIYEGEEVTLPILNLEAGTYYFQVIDTSGNLVETEAVVTQPDYPNYSQYLCATLNKCGTEFLLTFELTTEMYNYRPVYNCINPAILGMTELKIRFDTLGRWKSTNSEIQTENIQFDIPPAGCNLNGTSFLMEKTPQGPLALPQGSYVCQALFCGGTLIPVVTGGCPPKVRILSTDSYCAGPPVKLGQVIYEAVGGAGPPYLFFYSSDSVNYQQTNATQLSLLAGTFSIKVRDVLGTESNPISFTISSANQVVGSSSINFYTNVRDATITGTGLGGALQEGQYKEFQAEVENFYDFLDFPEGASFNIRLRTNLRNQVTTGDYGYETPITSQIVNFEIVQAWVDNGNGPVNFYENPELNFEPQNSQYQGSSTYGEDNLGFWKLNNIDTDTGLPTQIDNCQNGVARTSPNTWINCDFTANIASFIEGDTRGSNFSGEIRFDSEQILINNNTKIYIRYKVKLRNNTPVFIPTILRETDATTLQPPCYTPLGCSKLNNLNTGNSRVATSNQFNVSVSWFARQIVTPPTQPCVQIANVASNLNSTTPGGTVVTTNFKFSLNSQYGILVPYGSNSISEFQQLNQFISQNTTSTPSWAP